MKIIFLGVGAGEFYPAMLCNCSICSKYRTEGKILGFSSILIDDQYLVDCPLGTALNFALFKIKPKFPFHILITHSHQDHFAPSESISVRKNSEDQVFTYMNQTTLNLLKHYQKFNRFYSISPETKVIAPFKKIRLNQDDFAIPILANHDKFYNEECLNFIFKIKNKTLLYASDTGWYDNEKTWQEILKHKYDIVILEFSFIDKINTHMNYKHFLKFIEHLRTNQCMKSKTQIIATHLHLHQLNNEKTTLLEEAGVKIAYRGMHCEC